MSCPFGRGLLTSRGAIRDGIAGHGTTLGMFTERLAEGPPMDAKALTRPSSMVTPLDCINKMNCCC